MSFKAAASAGSGSACTHLLLILLLGTAGMWPLESLAAETCSFSGSVTMAFGEVGTGGKDASGALSVTCRRDIGEPVAFRVCIFLPEGSPLPGINPRRMTNNNGAQMLYDLYSDSSRTRVIGPYGSTFPIYSQAVNLTSFLVTQQTIQMPVYGRVPAGQSLPSTHAFQAQLNGGVLRYSYNIGSWFFGMPSPPTDEQCRSGTGASGSGVVTGFYTGVTATFANTCHISAATDLQFGEFDSIVGGNRDQTSRIDLTCPNGATWNVGLNNGINASGTTRRMRSPGGAYVTYDLYREPNRSQRWGSTIGTDTAAGTGTGGLQSLTVYGRVPPQATPAPGIYSDTVTVTLTF